MRSNEIRNVNKNPASVSPAFDGSVFNWKSDKNIWSDLIKKIFNEWKKKYLWVLNHKHFLCLSSGHRWKYQLLSKTCQSTWEQQQLPILWLLICWWAVFHLHGAERQRKKVPLIHFTFWHTHTITHSHIHTNTHNHRLTHAHICTHTHTYTHTITHKHPQNHTLTHICIHTHTYTHTHTLTHTRTKSLFIVKVMKQTSSEKSNQHWTWSDPF